MNTKIYGLALAERMGINTNGLTTLIHEIVRLCRTHGATLIKRDNGFMLNYQGTSRIVGNTYDELFNLKMIFEV